MFRASFVCGCERFFAAQRATDRDSGDLDDWQPGADPLVVLAEDAAHEVVAIPFPALVSTLPPQFFKVSVTIAP